MLGTLVSRVASLLAVLLLSPLILTTGVQTARAAAPEVSGVETDLGVQMAGRAGSIRSEQSAQGVLRDGRYLAFFANSGGPGIPARFFAMDLAGTTVAEVSVPTGSDVLTVAYSPASRTVFLAANTASSGYLYEWDGTRLEQVGTISDELIVRVAVAPDGAVYIGTYAPSDGRLHVYSDGTITDLGQPLPGESYVRSLAVDSTSVWLSNYRESGAKLVRVDRATNRVTVIPAPDAFGAEWSAMDMSLAGDHLFLRMVNSPLLFAYNTVTRSFDTFDDQVARVSPYETRNVVPYITGISPYGISPLIEGRYVYFQRSGAGIMRIDVANGLKTIRVDKWNRADNPVSWPGASVAGPVSYAWLEDVGGRTGRSLVTTTIEGKVLINSPGQTAPSVLSLQAKEAPSTIISLGTDAGGAVYTGGFDLPAGVGRFSTEAGTTSVLPGPQIEGFGRFDGSVVMGGYTGNSSASAPLYLYSGSGEPQLRTYLNNGQERPVALVQVGRTMAIGTVPIKNTLGGSLTLWDPATNELTVERDIVPDHSVISLATHDGLVVGGSSNAGGTGSVPTATSGQIFTYDPSTGAVKTFTPPRATSSTYSWVAAITPDPSGAGRFWAISTGYIIQFEVAPDGGIRLTKNLGAFPATSSPTGKELGIKFVDGIMFATVGQQLAAINTVTGEQTVVAPKTSTGPVVGLVKTGDDTLYYARGARLYSYTVAGAASATSLAAPTVTSPDVDAVQGPGSIVFSGTGTKNSTVTLSDGTRTRSTRLADSTWTMGAMDFVPGTHQLTFTASLAGFEPQVTRVTLVVSLTPSDPCAIVAPRPTNIAVGGYNAPNRDYAFEGTGTPGSLVTMVNGTRTRTATVREDGTWSMNPVWFGWWAGTTAFTASLAGCPSVTNDVMATFATKPSTHVAPLVISHTEAEFYPGGNVSFKGKGTPGAMVTMKVGNQMRFAAVSTTGRWHMRAIAITDAPVTVTFQSAVPGHPDRVTTFDAHFGAAPTEVVEPLLTSHSAGSVAASGDVVFSGKGTPNSKISVTVDGRTVSAFVRSSGRWDVPSVPVTPGTHEVTLESSSPGVASAVARATLSFE